MCGEEETMATRWLVLGLVLCSCVGGLCFCNDDDGPEPLTPGEPQDGSAEPGSTPGPIVELDSRYVRLTPGALQTFNWTSTGPGQLTASISWTSAASLTLYLDRGGIVAQQSGSSPLQVSAHADAAGEAWTIGMRNDSGVSATVAYTLTFQSD
jgi:hypothetical protein